MARLLVGIETLVLGGAERFATSLAIALSDSFEFVYIYVLYPYKVDKSLVADLPRNVKLVYPRVRFNKFVEKLDSILFRLNIDFSFRDALVRKDIERKMKELQVNFLHTHLFKTDYIFYKSNNFDIPHFATIHGDYINFDQKNKSGETIYKLLNYPEKLNEVLDSGIRLITISDSQQIFFKNQNAKINCRKIYNGYLPSRNSKQQINSKVLGIEKLDFVFGMVGRGIPEKGWKQAIDAFIAIGQPRTHLILVGSSKYLDKLTSEYSRENIHFVGYSPDPLAWIRLFDVGLHPSFYLSESLPTVLIEYLYCGVPSIASDVGESSQIIDFPNIPSGIIVKKENLLNGLINSMQLYMKDKEILKLHKRNTSFAFTRFEMDSCARKYLNEFSKEAL